MGSPPCPQCGHRFAVSDIGSQQLGHCCMTTSRKVGAKLCFRGSVIWCRARDNGNRNFLRLNKHSALSNNTSALGSCMFELICADCHTSYTLTHAYVDSPSRTLDWPSRSERSSDAIQKMQVDVKRVIGNSLSQNLTFVKRQSDRRNRDRSARDAPARRVAPLKLPAWEAGTRISRV